MPLFSVIVPVFNRDPTPALKSVQAQTFEGWECLVVDDGSSDDRAAAAVGNMKDPRFRYVRRENGGVCAARNTGIDEAAGEYVAFLDSDDEWLPSKLEADRQLLAPNRVIFSQVAVVRNGQRIGERPPRAPGAGEDISEYLACHQGFTQPSTITLHRDAAKQVKFDPALGFLGIDDTDLAIRLSHAGYEFQMHPHPLAVMYDNETGDRLSRKTYWRPTLEWLDRIRPLMTNRAYLACRAWHVARMAAQGGERGIALRFYFAGLHALPLKLKVKALLQILIPRRLYKSAQSAFVRFQAVMARTT